MPLILYSPPSIMREIALATLERSGRPWRIVCTSDSLSGLRAASLAGLGITVISEGLIPAGLTEIPGGHERSLRNDLSGRQSAHGCFKEPSAFSDGLGRAAPASTSACAKWQASSECFLGGLPRTRDCGA